MTKAINTHIASAKLIEASSFENDKTWDNLLNTSSLKLILISEEDFKKLPHLAKLCNKNDKEQIRFQNIPALIMPSPDTLAQNATLKQALWNTLKAMPKSSL
jgi:hypothetical protein